MTNIQKIIKPYLRYVDSLDEKTKTVLKWYTDEDGISEKLNKLLRKRKPLPKDYQEYHDTIIKAFNNGPLFEETLTVYRGTDVFVEKEAFLEQFVSTSYDPKVSLSFAEDKYLYIITLTPGNYTILPLENINERDEKEILLPPNGKFSIQRILKDNDPENKFGITVVYMTYIPEKSVIIGNSMTSSLLEKIRYFLL